MIALSVHLITYNNEAHIEDTLKSILKQKCNFDFEIVVGDDCSTDKTLEIINSFSQSHPSVFNIKKNPQQLGILKNFKATLDRCKGNYVFDIAGDDVIKTDDAFEKIMAVFSKNPTLGFVDSGYDKYIVTKNNVIPFVNKASITTSKERYKELIFLGKVIPVGICYNKDALYKYVDFETYISKNITIEDYPILVDLVCNSDFRRLNNVLFEYKIHNASYTQKRSFERAHFLRGQMLELFNLFDKKYQYPKKLRAIFEENHYKALLFLAGVYQQKSEGKYAFNSIIKKSTKDYIHYLASQYPVFRNTIRLRRKLLEMF